MTDTIDEGPGRRAGAGDGAGPAAGVAGLSGGEAGGPDGWRVVHGRLGLARHQPTATTWVGRKVTLTRSSVGPEKDARSVP
jgi:hypothetical protein